MGSWAAATPPGRSGGTNAGTEAGVRTAVLATTLPGKPVRPLPEFRLRNPFLISKLPPNFAQLDSALRS